MNLFLVKSRGPILRVTSSETRSGFALAKFEYLLLIGQCRSQRWSRDTFLLKLRLYEKEESPRFLYLIQIFGQDKPDQTKPNQIKSSQL